MSTQIHTFVFNPVSENTYLLVDEATREAAIVDVGCMNEEEIQQLESVIEKERARPALLLFTHMHFDHIWGAPYFAQRYNLPPLTHKQEIATSLGFREQMKRFMMLAPSDYEEVLFEPVETGQLLRYGESILKVLFVPGHSAGHIAFYNEVDGFVLTGDALFRGDIGRTDLPGGSYHTLLRSISSELMSLPDDTAVYPGHGPSSSIQHEKQFNPYLLR